MPDASQQNIKPPSWMCISVYSVVPPSEDHFRFRLTRSSQKRIHTGSKFQPEQDVDAVNDKLDRFNLPALNRLKITASRTWNHGDLHGRSDLLSLLAPRRSIHRLWEEWPHFALFNCSQLQLGLCKASESTVCSVVCVTQENKVRPFEYVSAISSVKEVGGISLLLWVQIFRSSLASETCHQNICSIYKGGKKDTDRWGIANMEVNPF